VKTETDLDGLMVFIALRGSDVFSVLAEPKASAGGSPILNSLF